MAFRIGKKTEAGRYQFDSFKLGLPLLGNILKSYAISRFSRTLSTLVSGGIPLVTAIEITAQAVGNAVFERALEGVARRVKEGEAMWESIERTELFNDMTTEMIKVGESTGSLEEMLSNISDFLDEEIDQKLTMVALVEPLMLVFMAVLVGMIMLAIYYPLLRLYPARPWERPRQ
jgi:type IV pilus assembly protein PilC